MIYPKIERLNMICTFFGHKNTSESIKIKLRNTMLIAING